jgi:hypothetical protein
MEDTTKNICSNGDGNVRLRRVIEHADASVAGWSPEKRRDATLTFYSRSSEASKNIACGEFDDRARDARPIPR